MSTSESPGVLRHDPCDFIGGEPHRLHGDGIVSHNPAHPARIIWRGSQHEEHVDAAVTAARSALPIWSAWPIERRAEVLRHFQQIVRDRVNAIADLICAETGKARWDSLAEAGLLAGKVDITLAEGPQTGRSRVTSYQVSVGDSRRGVCHFRPHGVMAVLGPFNFPAHLPNGHIVPALLMGNTLIFKPSDKTPAVGQMLAELFIESLDACGAPKGVFNLVQGGAEIAARLVDHDGLDGILFTGSWPVGRRILEANLDRPGRIIALELGGNNPAVVMPDCDLKQAALECVRAAFITTGQRCTCTRRVIVHREVASRFIPLVQKVTSTLLIGDPMEGEGGQEVFMGPIVRAEAREAVLRFQRNILGSGGESIVEARAIDHPGGGHYLSPGIVEVGRFTRSDDPALDSGCDVEVFGPLLRISQTDGLDDAIEQANATRYGLASAIFTRDERTIERFLAECRAGCVNVNNGTAGASGKLPFGGLGQSGNHRPAGAFSLDYCACPVASMIESGSESALSPGMTFDEAWLG